MNEGAVYSLASQISDSNQARDVVAARAETLQGFNRKSSKKVCNTYSCIAKYTILNFDKAKPFAIGGIFFYPVGMKVKSLYYIKLNYALTDFLEPRCTPVPHYESHRPPDEAVSENWPR